MISREEAIKTLQAMDDIFIGDCTKEAINMAIEALRQDERPKGRWEKGICTNCGKDVYEDIDADIWSAYIPPFCPDCGADMRGEEE